MARPRFYRILEYPFVYNTAGMILAPGAKTLTGRVYRKLFAGSHGLVLDIGCGPRLRTPEPDGLVVGVDVNPDYLRSYTGGVVDDDPDVFIDDPGDRTRFGFRCEAEQLPFDDHLFDEVRCRAMLHHIPPDGARGIIQEGVRCLRSTGRFVIIDCIWPHNACFRPIAWLIHRCDRGEWIRSERELVALAESATRSPWETVRYTSAYNGLEELALIYEKPAALRLVA